MDHQRTNGKKRSTLKSKQAVPEGLSMQQFLSNNQNKKNLKWDQNITELEMTGELPITVRQDESSDNKMDVVAFIFYIG